LNTRHAHYILAIVENNGNLTKAAEKMFVTQPALSQILKKTEENHGVTLFDRSRNPMTLTRAGANYVKAARMIENIQKSLQREFDDERNLEAGELHVGVTPFRASYVLPKVLASYHRKYPGIKIILHQAPNRSLAQSMENYLTDITIGNIGEYSNDPKHCVSKVLSDEELLIVAPAHHKCAKLGLIEDLSLLEDELFLISPMGERLRDVIDDFFKRRKFAPKHILETNNAELSLGMIAEGTGVSIMCDAIRRVKHTEPAPAFIRFAGQQPLPRLVTSATYLKHKYFSAAARAFLRELEDSAGSS
jgi:DNA-binding transcriptional LysR family regulator